MQPLAPTFDREVQRFLFQRGEADTSTRIKNEARDRLKNYLLSEDASEHWGAYEDGSGNICVDFETPLNIAGKVWKGLQLRRVQGAATLDEDWAFNYIEENGLTERAVKIVVLEEIDQNELAVLNQEGIISDDDLDQMFTRPEVTWALYPVEA